MIERDKHLYKYPPDVECIFFTKVVSKKHRYASRIFKKYSDKSSLEECECCNKKLGDAET